MKYRVQYAKNSGDLPNVVECRNGKSSADARAELEEAFLALELDLEDWLDGCRSGMESLESIQDEKSFRHWAGFAVKKPKAMKYRVEYAKRPDVLPNVVECRNGKPFAEAREKLKEAFQALEFELEDWLDSCRSGMESLESIPG